MFVCGFCGDKDEEREVVIRRYELGQDQRQVWKFSNVHVFGRKTRSTI